MLDLIAGLEIVQRHELGLNLLFGRRRNDIDLALLRGLSAKRDDFRAIGRPEKSRAIVGVLGLAIVAQHHRLAACCGAHPEVVAFYKGNPLAIRRRARIAAALRLAPCGGGTLAIHHHGSTESRGGGVAQRLAAGIAHLPGMAAKGALGVLLPCRYFPIRRAIRPIHPK